LPVLDWILGNEMLALAISATHVDTSSKSSLYWTGIRNILTANKIWTKQNKFHFLFTGDELWMFYVYDYRMMWMNS
jgi:hypothetical protein